MLVEELSPIGLVNTGKWPGLGPQALRKSVGAVMGKVRCYGIDDDDNWVTQTRKVLR